MDAAGAGLVGTAVPDDGPADHQARTLRLRLRRPHGLGDARQVVAVHRTDDVPAVGGKPLRHVFQEGDVRVAFNGYAVVVVEVDELVQPQRAGQRRGLGGDAFLQVAVGNQGVGVVTDYFMAGAVVTVGQPTLGDGHSHAVGKPLSQGAGGQLDARIGVVFRVAGVLLPNCRKLFRSSREIS